MTAATSWTSETGKTQCDRIIRHPNGRTIRPKQPDDPTLEKKVGLMLGVFTREPVSRVGKFASGSDDPTRGIWSIGVMVG